MNLRVSTWDELYEREAGVAARRMLFTAVVVRPPIPPGTGVLTKRSSSDGFQRGANQALRRRVERIVIEKVQQLGDRGKPLLPSEQAGSRQGVRCALADLRAGARRWRPAGAAISPPPLPGS